MPTGINHVNWEISAVTAVGHRVLALIIVQMQFMCWLVGEWMQQQIAVDDEIAIC